MTKIRPQDENKN